MRLFAGFLGHLGKHDLLLELFQIRALFAFAQFLLDRLDLLVQVILALRLFHLALDATTDALFDLKDVEFAFQLAEQVLVALGHVENFQDDLLLLQLQRQMRGNGVGQATGVVDACQRSENLGRDLFVELHILVELLDDRATHRFDLRFIARLGFHGGQLGGEMAVEFSDLVDACALCAFDQHFNGAVGQLQHLKDVGNATDFVDIFGRGLILGGCLLGSQHDALALLHGGFERLD